VVAQEKIGRKGCRAISHPFVIEEEFENFECLLIGQDINFLPIMKEIAQENYVTNVSFLSRGEDPFKSLDTIFQTFRRAFVRMYMQIREEKNFRHFNPSTTLVAHQVKAGVADQLHQEPVPVAFLAYLLVEVLEVEKVVA